MKTFVAAIAATLPLLSTVGCSVQARSPEPVPLDRVECAGCRMLISTQAGGGEIVSPREETRFYDDIGCLAAGWTARKGDGTAFVRLNNGGWSEAQAASYARPAAANTAMGSGILAYPSVADARAADRAGQSLTWIEVVSLAAARR